MMVCSILALAGCGGGDRAFDSGEWKAESDVYCDNPNVPHLRQEMVGDLLDEHLGVGMRQAAVRELLGPPDSIEKGRPGTWWTYYTGNDQIDCLTLEILFNGGRVLEAYEAQT